MNLIYAATATIFTIAIYGSSISLPQECVDEYWAFNGSSQVPAGLTVDYNSANVQVKDGVLNLILNKKLGGTRISVDQLFYYGTVEATMEIAAGSNVITAFILMAENGDEIDFEFVGKDKNIIQTNYFYQGKPIYNIHAVNYAVNRDLTTTFHKYTIHWTPEYYEWRINGRTLRKMFKNETIEYPESPSKIQIGIWNANPSKWAGDGINWKDEPFIVRVNSIKLTCYDKNREIIIPPIDTVPDPVSDYCKNLYQ
jgi:beta-glucanase (GH16 family)